MNEKDLIDELLMQKSLKETFEILNKLDKDEFNKIPNNFVSYVRDNMDDKYAWKYDESKSLEEQKLSKYTIPLLASINYDYLLDNKQKEVVKKIYMVNEEKENILDNETQITTIKEKSLFSKIIFKIKNFFK